MQERNATGSGVSGREGRDRTCHSRYYPSATGFEDQLKHQFRLLYNVKYLRKIIIKKWFFIKVKKNVEKYI